MTWAMMNADTASQLAGWLWSLLMLVWIVLWFGMKKAKKLETPGQILQHALPVTFGFWLLFENNWKWLNVKIWPVTPSLLWAGVGLTAAGVAISIWARVTLGANWSGVVTLKKGHELIRKGLYRWIRHPIYTGILISFIGTDLIKGHLRGWVGFALVLATFYFKARREERFLRQEFGAGFEEHARRTGMFLPKWT
ncbi:MAG TPA: isoprenylcysteine carboxylmethyltransferase family protein [Candidatus Sulfotelmatobacter sp.]|nr:isoprenylcysteine carboxylmethyltransferase family protein [Candidatus Sulfotelmatobacter sp.]